MKIKTGPGTKAVACSVRDVDGIHSWTICWTCAIAQFTEDGVVQGLEADSLGEVNGYDCDDLEGGPLICTLCKTTILEKT